MDNGQSTKKIMSHETIYKIMQWLPVGVSSLFFLKNIGEGNSAALWTIGICVIVFVGMLIFVKVRKVGLYVKEYLLAIALPILVCTISLNSGASYSDDFSLYLAVIALTGLYLEPKFTLTQFILVDICLVIMYVAHPEKAESLSQYILCVAVFTLAAVLFYLVIKRGRAFIELGEKRADESERLLASIRAMGADLQRDFASSSAKIEAGTMGLKEGSVNIAHGSDEVSDSCNLVHDKILEAEAQIGQMNKEVRQFEDALVENKGNVEAMNIQLDAVSNIINESGAVFRTMEEQMHEIADIAKQINDISFKLTILSLNASVESAHAGEYGAGFEVLAAEMRALSESSGNFSNQVSEAVRELSEKVSQTSERFEGSEEAIAKSEKAMAVLTGSFEKLNEQFATLYDNVERQNKNVSQIDYIFAGLNQRVSDMQSSSIANQNAVEAIADAMDEYRDSVGRIVENTQKI